MLQRIGTEILTPRGRIVDICNIDMFDNNNNVKKNDTNFAFQFCRVPKYTEFCSTILIIKLIFIFKNKNVPN